MGISRHQSRQMGLAIPEKTDHPLPQAGTCQFYDALLSATGHAFIGY